MRGVRVLVIVSAAAAVLAGCGEQVDTAKQTYTRTTVPAGQADGRTGTTGDPKTNDAAFTMEKLRKLDPCGLLTDDILSAVGDPEENRSQDFGECANYMKDKDGRDLSITLYVGEQADNAVDADENIGGLPALENKLEDGEACFVTVVTSTNPNFGVKLQAGGDSDDLCAAGRTIMTGIVELVRSDPPNLEVEPGSMATVDPCTVLDAAAIRTAMGTAVEPSPYNLHWCNWTGDGASVGMWFRTGYAPKEGDSESGQPVDLGNGVTGYQRAETAGGDSCRLEWLHRATSEEDSAEVVTLNVDRSQPQPDVTACTTAAAVAKLLVPALPKA